MSKKDDRINFLEDRYEAAAVLIHSISGALSVRIENPITMHNVHALTSSMLEVISGLHEGASGAITVHSNPNQRGGPAFGLAGGNLHEPNSFAEMDEAIDRANAKLDPDAVARAGRAMGAAVASDAGSAIALRKDYPLPENTLGGEVASESMAILGAVDDIRRELGLGIEDPDASLAASLREVSDEILRIKNPSGDVAADAAGALSKGDTLGEAIAHNREAQQNLELELVKARSIIQRVAGAMQIGQWDADGTELVERAQRWDSFKHALRKSLDVWRARAASLNLDTSNPAGVSNALASTPVGAIVLELTGFLALLTSHKDLAAWLKNKPKVASDALLSVAQEIPSAARRFDLKDINRIVTASGEHGFGEPWFEDLRKIEGSAVASAEFVNLMNLVILPILARQGA